jgi:hypothetical protein
MKTRQCLAEWCQGRPLPGGGAGKEVWAGQEEGIQTERTEGPCGGPRSHLPGSNAGLPPSPPSVSLCTKGTKAVPAAEELAGSGDILGEDALGAALAPFYSSTQR